MISKKEQLNEKCSMILSRVIGQVEDRISGLLSCGAIDVASWDNSSYSTPRVIIAVALKAIFS